MERIKKLRVHLEKLRRTNSNELEFGPIEKWMKKELNVVRLPNKGGSHILFSHPAIEEYNELGHFQVALAKGKKKDIIYRDNFREYLYRFLKTIIDYLEQEEQSE